MPDTPSNADRIRAAYAHWQETLGQDAEPFFALMDERVEMGSVLGPSDLDALAEDHRGLAGVRAYFDALAANWGGEMIDFPTERVVEDRATRWCGSAAAAGATGTPHVVVSTPKVDIWTFREGRAVQFFEMLRHARFRARRGAAAADRRRWVRGMK